MADATDSKSVARKGVWVQVPPPAFGPACKGEQVLIEEYEFAPIKDGN